MRAAPQRHVCPIAKFLQLDAYQRLTSIDIVDFTRLPSMLREPISNWHYGGGPTSTPHLDHTVRGEKANFGRRKPRAVMPTLRDA